MNEFDPNQLGQPVVICRETVTVVCEILFRWLAITVIKLIRRRSFFPSFEICSRLSH
jgi:hypothetical protein